MLGEGSSHGINIERFSADADITRADAETQRWLDEDPSVTVVGFVGRLHPDKGVDTLLDALRACSARGTAVRDEGRRTASAQEQAKAQIAAAHAAGEDSDDALAKDDSQTVSLRQRAAPFIEMLRRSLAGGHDVVWGA